MGEVLIRQMKTADIERLCEIAISAWLDIHDGYREYIDNDDLVERSSRDWKERKATQIRVKTEERPDEVIVAEIDGHIIGFSTFHVNCETGIGEIGNNAVNPDYQGFGVGKVLYNKVLKIFREHGMKYAIVSTGYEDPGHAKARACYEKIGFEKFKSSITYSLEL
jgi:N-acetylglutamate synthase-like GNAT family acetyltransferase